jgi:hypothetical protein
MTDQSEFITQPSRELPIINKDSVNSSLRTLTEKGKKWAEGLGNGLADVYEKGIDKARGILEAIANPPSEIVYPHDESLPFIVLCGNTEVVEDFKTNLLTPQEKKMYHKGFDLYKKLIESTPEDIKKSVLTVPGISSVIIGYQPTFTVPRGEAMVVRQAFERSGTDFDNRFAIIENTAMEDGDHVMIVNLTTAKKVIDTYQPDLETTNTDNILDTHKTVDKVVSLLSDDDPKKSNFAYGLLSGYSKTDAHYFVNSETSKLHQFRFAKIDSMGITYRGHSVTEEPGLYLNPVNYERESDLYRRNYYIPGVVESQNERKLSVLMGLRWKVEDASVETVANVQKILQINRELGLTEYVDLVRSKIGPISVSN